MHHSVWSEQEEDEGYFIYREEDWPDTSNDLLLPDTSFIEDNLREED